MDSIDGCSLHLSSVWRGISPCLETPLFLISLYRIFAIIRYLLSIDISLGRENFLSVKLNQLRLQLSLAVKLLLQSLCLKLANSLSLPPLAASSCPLLPLLTQAR